MSETETTADNVPGEVGNGEVAEQSNLELEDSELLNEDDDTALPFDESASKNIEEDEMQLQEEEEEHGNEEMEGDQCVEDAGVHEEDGQNADREEDVAADDGVEEGDEEPTDVNKEEKMEEEEDEEEEEEEEEADKSTPRPTFDPNVMPQVNVQILAKRKWQVKVYPLKASDFMSGYIHKVFKDAKESLLYLISSGKYSRGKGEMYISSVTQTLRVVQGLMKRDGSFPEVNIEVIKKNDEGVVEEKAYMRFDSKMVRMLFNAPSPGFTWGVHGRKRERLIGSVFVKNLPATTSKDMLRVMFPFAQEINYNPEKFKEGTARLVLKSRASVIPCLKAFVKVELGGQVLELHPLEKKRNTRDDKSKSESRRRSRSASVKSDDGKEETSVDSMVKKDSSDGEKGDADDSVKGEDLSKKSDSAKAKSQSSDKKTVEKKKGGSGSRTPSSRKPGSKKDEEGDRSRERSKDNDKSRKNYSNRSAPSRGSQSFNSRSEGFRSRGSTGFRGRRGGMRGGGMDRRYNSGALSTDVARNAEVTKDMLVLQSQLSMAIKSQLSVLNQTKMAVEQAKIGAASTLGIGASPGMSDAELAYESRGLHARDRRDSGGGGYGQKRKAPQNDRGYGKRMFKGKTPPLSRPRSGGRGGGRSADYDMYAREEEEYRREMYARAEELRASEASYGAGLGSGSYGASRAAYGDYYGYGGY